jgi:hypothetical protein
MDLLLRGPTDCMGTGDCAASRPWVSCAVPRGVGGGSGAAGPRGIDLRPAGRRGRASFRSRSGGRVSFRSGSGSPGPAVRMGRLPSPSWAAPMRMPALLHTWRAHRHTYESRAAAKLRQLLRRRTAVGCDGSSAVASGDLGRLSLLCQTLLALLPHKLILLLLEQSAKAGCKLTAPVRVYFAFLYLPRILLSNFKAR